VIGPLAGYPVTQLGFVVADLDGAIGAFGGTWQRPEIPAEAFEDIVYRGGTAELDHLVALSDAGPPQLELIQPGGGPNIWQEWLDDGHTGIHHAAVEVPSALALAGEMERAGFPVVMSGRFGGDGEFAYFDARSACGIYVETLTFPASWRP
jgi:glyoxalase/bleomycin resistance protein/dioxygenase superfamily protein